MGAAKHTETRRRAPRAGGATSAAIGLLCDYTRTDNARFGGFKRCGNIEHVRSLL
jgi:hypothetical protein